ncbi:hypothetical protein SORBI_3002G028566 [Sorghum bicolor]|uniref:Uncharacterized protein n=1 Tax=Sorghum bicolor TaxID=4558 RepID=A0A1W0W218_SORBI|nr:hypothetical protein SORBI_3002G028566 [Sorghum bicolor]
MEPGSNQDGVVNMTRAIEALSPWLKHPRRTIIQVERLVIAAAVLLLLQLVFGCCKRQWHNSFLKYGLQLWTKLMDPLIIYTLGTMQPSPIKNSSYPVWAGFLIMASAGTAAVQQYDFCDSYVKKAIQACVEYLRYCAYLIGYVPELLPYHEADIAELSRKFMEERTELFGFFYRRSKIYGKMKNLEGTGVGDDPRRIFEKGVKLGKQLQKVPNTNLRWEVLKDFWAKTIIHAAASHYTTKQHMQHLENGGEFLTHIWALLAHAGILGLDWNKGQAGQDNLGSGPSVDI